MNFINGKVEWHGNGVVVIKERTVMRAIWRLYIHGERRLHSVLQRVGGLLKSVYFRRTASTQGFKGNGFKGNGFDEQGFEEQGFDVTGFEKCTFSIHPAEQMTSSLNQPQTVVHEPTITETGKLPSWPKKVRPMGTLTEIRRCTGADPATVANGDEPGALQQLLPALAGFCHDRWLVLVSPPQRPQIAELTAAGIDPSRVLLVHAHDSAGHKNAAQKNTGLKTVEKALQSGTCGAVVAWLEECDISTLQRLRHAAVAGHAWGVMFREGEIGQTMTFKTERQLSSLSVSTLPIVNGKSQDSVVFSRNTRNANTAKVVNILSDSTKKQKEY